MKNGNEVNILTTLLICYSSLLEDFVSSICTKLLNVLDKWINA